MNVRELYDKSARRYNEVVIAIKIGYAFRSGFAFPYGFCRAKSITSPGIS
tara:strand:- start:14706 stop:14855 length:150 start_codon:yes stop_codon:yes gene_type:complete